MTSTYDLLEFATPELSIVIPAHNDETRIGDTLDSIASFLREQSLHAEVIVVDDGSTDLTGAIVEAHNDEFVDLRLLRCERNGGKGRAVRLGMMVARGRLRVFMDASRSADIREFEHLRASAKKHATLPEVIIASLTTTDESVKGTVHRGRDRVSRLGTDLVRRTVLPGIADARHGFKMFTAEAADEIFSRSRINGGGFDIEVLAIARALGFHILEVPVPPTTERAPREPQPGCFAAIVDVARVRRSLRRTRRMLGATSAPTSGKDADARDGLRIG
jgi:dolichyl-phosphate beta-glucosyltransferase